MTLRIQLNCEDVDWNLIPDILEQVGMAFYRADIHRKCFLASAAVVFVYDESKLIGFGRAISDGYLQAAIYDVAVLPDYQAQGVGRQIIEQIMSFLPGCNFILYAAPGKEPFYRKMNFSLMKTGMAQFVRSEHMRQKGFTD